MKRLAERVRIEIDPEELRIVSDALAMYRYVDHEDDEGYDAAAFDRICNRVERAMNRLDR